MSYGRVTTVEFNSEKDAEELKVHYRENDLLQRVGHLLSEEGCWE